MRQAKVRTTVLALLVIGAGARAADVPFTDHVISSGAVAAHGVFAADVDGDGDTDVLSASFDDDTIAWYENTGGAPPVFSEHPISSAADGAFSVFAADVDGDGDTDVLSASQNDDTIAWYESDGASPPVFTEHLITTAADEAVSVFAADVDGDGDLDILAASALDDTIAWFENDGALPFPEHEISTAADNAFSVFAADVDGDGDTDVLSASEADDTIAWYENDGASPPAFTERVVSSTADGAFSVFAADVDGDGDTDILSASALDDTVAWYESDGGAPPAFTEHDISTSADGAISVFAADVDRDGDVDVLAALANDGRIAWYDNDGGSPPGFTERTVSTGADQPFSVFAADVDGDGQMDVLSASQADDEIAWYENGTLPPGDVPFVEHVLTTTAAGALSVFAADVDGDGDTDVLFASEADDTIGGFANDGSFPPAFTQVAISTAADGAYSVFAADVDGDGDADVLSASGNDDKIAWYENDGALPFPEHVISLGADNARAVFAVDLDRDGDMDVLSASRDDDKIAWYESNGSPIPGFTEHAISTSADGALSVVAADLDGDGHLDVVSASRFDDTIAWYHNLGFAFPIFDPFVISNARDFPRSVFVADVDGDGDLDVLSASSADDTIAWYENGGGMPFPPFVTFTDRVISTTADGATSVFAADVDGDGDTDVLSASRLDDTVAWYENDGGVPPAFTEHVISTGADNARSVFAADVDGDGDLDVLAASSADDTIAWYENGRTDIVFGPPTEFEAAGEATLLAVGNLDTANAAGPLQETRDVVVLIPDKDPTMAGQVQVFLNPDGDGDLVPNAPIDTGAEPTGVAVGFFNDDPYLDLAVTNAHDGTVVVYPNDGLDLGGFPTMLTVFTLASGDPRAIAAGDFNGDGDADLAVTFDGDATVRLLFGDGSLGFSNDTTFPGGPAMSAIQPADIDQDKDFDLDVVVTSRDANAIVLVLLDHGGSPLVLDPLSTGEAPVDLALGDLDGDGRVDIVSADSGDDTLSVFLNQGGAVFAPRFTLRTGGSPLSVHAADLDGDTDLDLAVVATDPLIGRSVQVFENTTGGGGADGGGGGGALFLADPIVQSVNADPNFIRGGDFNLDGLSDLVTANADDGPTGGSVTVLLTAAPEAPCGPEDLDGDGLVGFGDILAIIARWGECPRCPQDLSGNGFVDFADILAVIAAWGPCG